MTTRSAHDGIHHNLRKIMVNKNHEITGIQTPSLFFNNKMMESKIMTAFPQDDLGVAK